MTVHESGLKNETCCALASLFSFLGMILCRFRSIDQAALQSYGNYFSDWEKICDRKSRKSAIPDFISCISLISCGKNIREAADFEFEHLLQNPSAPIALWESLWVSPEKLFFTRETIEVRQCYREVGIDLVAQDEAADYFGFEILFIAFLLDHIAHGSSQYSENLVNFWNAHLGKWGKQCAIALHDKATTTFWRSAFTVCHEAFEIFETEILQQQAAQ